MAKNDTILIDGIIDEKIELKLPSSKRDEAFEYFSFEQLLKDYDFSPDDFIHGSVDGRNDGGIDGFFIIVNGHHLTDVESFSWPRTGCVLDVWIITCKHHDTFKQAPLDNLVASISELFDFTIEANQFKGDYSEKIIGFRENLKFAYKKVASRISEFNVNFCYASRGNTSDIGESIISRSEQIVQLTKDSFGNCDSGFLFVGSTELVELYRKVPNYSLELPFIENLSSGERYVMLVNLKDYFSFLTSEGKLRRYLFDSNVRDFMGLNRVNDDIRETLLDTNSPDFWWLNNGVTILATDAKVIGKSIQIEGIQIVNGLQTSESIYRHFTQGGQDPKNRSVMVKVIVSNDDEVRDTIIRATNNQTNVELASLHATDKIQRDIEDILIQHDLYYERRANFYLNKGVPRGQILTPLYLAAGYLSLVLKSAHQATVLKQKFMRSQMAYERVFSESTDLLVWPQIARILKRTDAFIEENRPDEIRGHDHIIKRKRQFLSFLTISKIFGNFNFTVNDLVNFDIKLYNNEELHSAWKLIGSFDSKEKIRFRIGRAHFVQICKKAAEEWNVKGVDRILNQKELRYNGKPENVSKTEIKKSVAREITKEFALKVDKLLPDQPWKPGIHKKIIEELKCSNNEYFAAVAILIDLGIRNHQKDGVVYDTDGNVITFDEERVDKDTMKLF